MEASIFCSSIPYLLDKPLFEVWQHLCLQCISLLLLLTYLCCMPFRNGGLYSIFLTFSHYIYFNIYILMNIDRNSCIICSVYADVDCIGYRFYGYD